MMRGVTVVVGAMQLVVARSAALAGQSRHRLLASGLSLDEVTLVTYHKSGTVLAKGVNEHCFAGLGIRFEHKGNLVMPAVHFIRDPKALVRSAFDYHKVAGDGEVWLHDPNLERDWLLQDSILAQTYLPNETYQAYLNRVPFFIAIRAEFVRSASGELATMMENARVCMTSPESCKQVCLERFTHSTESYQQTWSAILDFLHLDQSYMDCIDGYNMLNPNYVGAAEEHVTHPTEFQIAVVNEEFAKFDEMYMNSSLSQAAAAWGCASTTLSAKEPSLTWDEEQRAASYA